MNVDVLDEIWCCLPDAHAGQIRATVEGVGSWRATLATERFPRVTLLHEDRPTVSDSDHLRGEAPSQEKRRPHEEAAGKKRHGIQNSANTAPGGNYGGTTGDSHRYHRVITSKYMDAPSTQRHNIIRDRQSVRCQYVRTFGLRAALLQRAAAFVCDVNIIPCGSDRRAVGWRRAAQANMHGGPPNGEHALWRLRRRRSRRPRSTSAPCSRAPWPRRAAAAAARTTAGRSRGASCRSPSRRHRSRASSPPASPPG